MYIGICRSFMATIYESGGSEAEHPEGRVGPEGDPSGGAQSKAHTDCGGKRRQGHG